MTDDQKSANNTSDQGMSSTMRTYARKLASILDVGRNKASKIFLLVNLLLYKKDIRQVEPSPLDEGIEVITSTGQLQQLVQDGYALGKPDWLPDCMRMLEEGQVLFGIFRDKLLVSSAWLAPHPGCITEPPYIQFEGETEGYFQHVFTVPEYRRRGLVRSLVQAMFGYLNDEGKRSVVVAVDKRNRASRNLFESSGFQLYSQCWYLKSPFYEYYRQRPITTKRAEERIGE